MAAPGFSLVRTSLELRIKIRLQFRLAVGFPGGSDAENLSAMWETWVHSLGQEDPLEEGILPTPVFLPGNDIPTSIQDVADNITLTASNGRIDANADFTIYNVLGKNVTSHNGHLKGVYVVSINDERYKILVP